MVNQAVLGIRRDDSMKVARTCRAMGDIDYCQCFIHAARQYNWALIRARREEKRDRAQAGEITNAFARHHAERAKQHWFERDRTGFTGEDPA